MDSKTREHRAYALENMLVLTMIGSAVALQVLKRRHDKGEGPLLVRLIDEVPGDVMPWPLNLVSELLDRD